VAGGVVAGTSGGFPIMEDAGISRDPRRADLWNTGGNTTLNWENPKMLGIAPGGP